MTNQPTLFAGRQIPPPGTEPKPKLACTCSEERGVCDPCWRKTGMAALVNGRTTIGWRGKP